MRNKNKRGGDSPLRPVKRIELSEKNIPLRIALAVGFFVIGMILLGIGLFSTLNTQPGWTEIKANPDKRNCSEDFFLNYDFSDSGGSASSLNKQLNLLYTQATEDAYMIFTKDEDGEGIRNLHYLNTHVNEAVEVHPVLYEALSLVREYGSRGIYLAPVYAEYDRVFMADSDVQAAQFDPMKNSEQADYIRELVKYCGDPEMIDLELLGENRVRLNVSGEYLSFAEEYEIEAFLDFNWMKNAFITDYIAGVLQENGFTSGYLASYDGFTRNLDSRGNTYSFNVFDRRGNTVYTPAVMNYSQPVSIVFLRDYRMTQQDQWYYYTYEDGQTVTSYVDPSDGLYKNAVDSLVSYSHTATCGEILLQMLPAYIAEEFSPDTLNALTEKEIYSIWCGDQVICYNQEAISLTLQPDSEGRLYETSFEG